MIEEAARRMPLAAWHAAPAEAIPLPDESVDLALSSLSFHHWTDQAKGLREIGRVLRPGGWFCLTDQTMPGWLARLLRSRSSTAARIRGLIRDAGLSGKSERTWGRFIFIELAQK
jgi:ubiquinone/menaquinone biosynthesis C-methylase UbiE